MPVVNLRSIRRLAVPAILAFLIPAAAPARQRAPNPPVAGAQAAPGAPSPAPASVLPGGSPVAGGPAPDIVVFYTGEVMGWTEPCG